MTWELSLKGLLARFVIEWENKSKKIWLSVCKSVCHDGRGKKSWNLSLQPFAIASISLSCFKLTKTLAKHNLHSSLPPPPSPREPATSCLMNMNYLLAIIATLLREIHLESKLKVRDRDRLQREMLFYCDASSKCLSIVYFHMPRVTEMHAELMSLFSFLNRAFSSFSDLGQPSPKFQVFVVLFVCSSASFFSRKNVIHQNYFGLICCQIHLSVLKLDSGRLLLLRMLCVSREVGTLNSNDLITLNLLMSFLLAAPKARIRPLIWQIDLPSKYGGIWVRRIREHRHVKVININFAPNHLATIKGSEIFWQFYFC